MEVIKVEHDFETDGLHESSFPEDLLYPEEQILVESAIMKKEVKEEPCVVPTIKEELPEEINIGELEVCPCSVEYSTNQKRDAVITADTSAVYANICVNSYQEGDTCSESETSFQEFGTQRNYSDTASDVETSNQRENQKDISKKRKRVIYKCKICSKSISRKENLTAHIRIHTSERPFRCEICNKSFIRRDGLLRHTRIHTGDKPFTCTVCNKSFIQRGDLVVHTRTHTGEKPFKCKICHKTFKQNSVLASHSRIHTEDKCFKCEVCNKVFTQHGGLVRHTRTHTGDKPFVCKVCNKSFTMRGDLSRHTRIHTRDKSDSFEVCDMSFIQCDDIGLHTRTCTGVNAFSC